MNRKQKEFLDHLSVSELCRLVDHLFYGTWARSVVGNAAQKLGIETATPVAKYLAERVRTTAF